MRLCVCIYFSDSSALFFFFAAVAASSVDNNDKSTWERKRGLLSFTVISSHCIVNGVVCTLRYARGFSEGNHSSVVLSVSHFNYLRTFQDVSSYPRGLQLSD